MLFFKSDDAKLLKNEHVLKKSTYLIFQHDLASSVFELFHSFSKKDYICHNSIQKNVMKNPLLAKTRLIMLLLTTFMIASCGSSTGGRYDKEEKKNTTDKTSNDKETDLTSLPKEDFDITPYKIQITVPEKKSYSDKNSKNIWFDYGSPKIENKTKSLVGTVEGFRVLVLTTDNPEEANQVKADIYFNQNANEVYVDFEPPFYKVKVGDFDSQKNADDLKFKLNQLGYKEAKVIKEKINVYK